MLDGIRSWSRARVVEEIVVEGGSGWERSAQFCFPWSMAGGRHHQFERLSAWAEVLRTIPINWLAEPGATSPNHPSRRAPLLRLRPDLKSQPRFPFIFASRALGPQWSFPRRFGTLSPEERQTSASHLCNYIWEPEDIFCHSRQSCGLLSCPGARPLRRRPELRALGASAPRLQAAKP